MAARHLKAVKLPGNEFALLNAIIVNPQEFPESDRVDHLELHSSGKDSVITLYRDNKIKGGEFGLGDAQRKWAVISLEATYSVKPYLFQKGQHLASVTFEVDFYQPTKVTAEPFDTDDMAREFLGQFPVYAFTKGQTMVFSFRGKPNLRLTVKTMSAIDVNQLGAASDGKAKKAIEPLRGTGLGNPNMDVFFERAEKSAVNLTGKSMAMAPRMNILNPEWDFQKMGIGGLDNEFSTIFRRAFASRVLPPDLIDQLGSKHVRGILLFGPPGTGKTLIARQIGKMLNSREPQIVSGPSVLDKFVGESEANIRKLFAPAEEEEKRMGRNSGLHIIIFDEIDAICKQRGSASGSTGVHDTIVNQLLAKMDGVDQLNNILVIGMTNRRDMIDEALLRPGRMEVQMEISLPDEFGRGQILNIHTATMRKNNKLGPDVDLKELASMTKNFSGAEIEGLVRAAQSTAINRLVKAAGKVEVDPDANAKLMVSRADFLSALETDIKPAFGSNEEVLDSYIGTGIIIWDESVQNVLNAGELCTKTLKSPNCDGIFTMLLEGPPNSGTTALAAHMCKNSGFPFVKICSPDEMVGFTETAKCLAIKKIFDDAYKSELSCLLIDDLEGLMEYTPVGPRFSNAVLQVLRVMLKKNPPKKRKLLTICTTSRASMLEEVGLFPVFRVVTRVNNISTGKQLVHVLLNVNDTFSQDDLGRIEKEVKGKRLWIGIKQLLAICSILGQIERHERARFFLEHLEEKGFIRDDLS